MVSFDDDGRMQQLFEAAAQCHQAMLTATTEEQLLSEFCRLVCTDTVFSGSWIGYKQTDSEQSIVPTASFAVDTNIIADLGLSWGSGAQGQHPAGEAIRSGRLVQVDDVDAERADWAEVARAQGYRSVVAVPLVLPGGEVLGVLCAGSDQRHSFSEDDGSLLTQLAADLAFGVSVVRQRESLRASDIMLRAAFDASPNAVAVSLLADGRFLDVNVGFTELFGWSRDEAIGKSPIEELPMWVDPEDRTRFVQQFSESERVKGFRTHFRRKDGSTIVGEMSSSTFMIQGEHCVLNAIRDVTAEQSAERDLRESEERFRHLVLASHDFIWEADMDGVYRYISPVVTEVLGYSASEMLGKSPFEFMPPAEADRCRQAFEAHCATSAPIREMVNVNYHKDGRIVYLETNGIPMLGESGELLGYRGADRDVTERLRAQHLINESHELLSQSQRLAKMGHYELDGATGMWSSSEALDEIFGIGGDYTRDLEGWVSLIHPDERDSMHAYFMDTVLGKRQPFDRQYRVVRPSDGSVRYVHGSGTLKFDGAGAFTKMFGVIQDVTASRQAEAELLLSEERYRSISESVTSFVYSCIRQADGRFQIDWMAGAVEQLTGHSPEQIHARGCWRFLVVPEDQAIFDEAVTGVAPGHSATAEFRIVGTMGQLFWIRSSVNASLLPSDEGTVRLIGSVEDITESRRAKDDLVATNIRLERVLKSITETMGKVVEARDPYTQGHEQGVARLSRQIAERMDLDEKTIETIEIAALVHDIGKLAVPTEILSKPTRLTDLEYRLIQEHSQAGYDILKGVDYGMPVAEIVLQHHERMDGSGYPGQLSGDDIMLEARVLAVADVIDAMASHRPYRASLGLEAATAELTRRPGVFDQRVVDAVLGLHREGLLKVG